MAFTVTITVVYLIIVSFLGYLGYKRTKTSQDYMVGGRQIHPMIMALSYGATFISTSAIVGFGGAAAQLGMGVLWLTFLNIFVGIFIAFVFFGKRTRTMGHNLDAHTFPELLGLRFNSRFIQAFSGLIIFVFMPIYAAAVLKGGVEFIQSHFGIPFEISLLIFTVLVAVYASMGGMKGLMYTDAFQGAIMFAGMAFFLIYTYATLGGVTQAHASLTDLFNKPEVQEQTANLIKSGFRGWTSMPEGGSPIWWSLVSSIVLGVGIGVLSQPQLTVRLMTVKSSREINRAVVSGGIFILMMTGVAFTVGALSNVKFFNDTGLVAFAPGRGVDSIIPVYIKQYMPPWFGSVFLLAMLAAAMSTLSAQYHVMGTSVGRDFYEKGLDKKGNSILITRTGMLVVIVISTILTWLASKLDVSTAIIARGTSLFFGLTAATFLPAYVGALYFKKMPKAAAIGGMISGFIASFIWIFFVNGTNAKAFQLCKLIFGKESLVAGTSLSAWSAVDAVVVGLPAAILVTGIIWMIYAAKNRMDMDQVHVEKCFEGIS